MSVVTASYVWTNTKHVKYNNNCILLQELGRLLRPPDSLIVLVLVMGTATVVDYLYPNF